MLKDIGHHWHDDAASDRTSAGRQDARHQRVFSTNSPDPARGRINLTATYHDACHLGHAQKIREQPRKLLAKIPGLKLVDLPETELCCGAAGTYNLTQPEMSAILSRRKLDNILSTGARAVLTANAGCLLQIAREARACGANRCGSPTRSICSI